MSKGFSPKFLPNFNEVNVTSISEEPFVNSIRPIAYHRVSKPEPKRVRRVLRCWRDDTRRPLMDWNRFGVHRESGRNPRIGSLRMLSSSLFGVGGLSIGDIARRPHGERTHWRSLLTGLVAQPLREMAASCTDICHPRKSYAHDFHCPNLGGSISRQPLANLLCR
jgi:hypothetical protein